MPECLLPRTASIIGKEALCYGVLSHVASLVNPVLERDPNTGLSAIDEDFSVCNRFPGKWCSTRDRSRSSQLGGDHPLTPVPVQHTPTLIFKARGGVVGGQKNRPKYYFLNQFNF